MISFYVSPPNIGLKFGTPTERDEFWARIAKTERNGFVAAAGAERIGNRTIRFHPAKMKEGFEWGLTNGAKAPEVAPSPAPAPAPVLPPAATQDFLTTNPFALMSPNAKPALPGLSPSPPPEMLAKTQPVAPAPPAVAVQPPAETVAAGDAAIEKMLAVSSAAETNPDPAPKDKRTRAYRDWKARQKV